MLMLYACVSFHLFCHLSLESEAECVPQNQACCAVVMVSKSVALHKSS